MNGFILRCTWLSVKVAYYLVPVISFMLKLIIGLIVTFVFFLLLLLIF